MADNESPKGRILRVANTLDGHSHVQLDNGPVNTITIMTRSEDLPELLASDLKLIRAHLMTRGPNHFRKKGG